MKITMGNHSGAFESMVTLIAQVRASQAIKSKIIKFLNMLLQFSDVEEIIIVPS